MTNEEAILTIAKRVKALADTGLLYAQNEYDKERYNELHQISLELMSAVSGTEINQLEKVFEDCTDYPTAKVDIRGLALNENGEILMVRESLDGKWALPGGWADIGWSPKEVIIKEFKEETGLDIEPGNLLAVFDKKYHPHPPQPFYVYKMVFHCYLQSDKIEKGFDVMEVGFFSIHNLPPLSEDRMLKSQIVLLYDKLLQGDVTAYVD